MYAEKSSRRFCAQRGIASLVAHAYARWMSSHVTSATTTAKNPRCRFACDDTSLIDDLCGRFRIDEARAERSSVLVGRSLQKNLFVSSRVPFIRSTRLWRRMR